LQGSKIKRKATRTHPVRPGGYGWRRQALTLAVVEIMTWAVRSNRTRHTKTDDQIFARIDRWSGECGEDVNETPAWPPLPDDLAP
jgi:hypothetical protein